jgi:glycine dehydrogenase
MTDWNHRLDPTDTFVRRHIGPTEADVTDMLETVGYASLDALADATIPASIRTKSLELTPLPGQQPRLLGEFELLEHLQVMADENQVFRSYIGMGYSDVIVPGVIQRNILESPGWYTQ